MSAEIVCSVCLNDINGSVNCATTVCGHKFHTGCLLKCVISCGRLCPYCRTVMTGETLGDAESEPAEELDEESDEEPIVVRKKVYNGVRYLVANITGKMFDYNAYVQNGEMIEVGLWHLDTEQVELFE